MAHQFKQPTPLRELVPDVPEALAAIVERLMQKAPEARFSAADEAAEEFLPLAGDLPTTGLSASLSASGLSNDTGSVLALPRQPLLPKSAASMQPLFPPAPAYPPAAGHAAPPAVHAQPQNLKMPTRQSLAPDEAERKPDFAMPPGFVEESRATTSLGPIAFAMVGLCVMVLSYMALLAFNPFK
jgi:hypothetical protein